MPSTLTNGVIISDVGERAWWDDYITNMTHLNDHNHNGVNSEKLSPLNFSKSTDTLLAANWVAVAGQAGTFKQTITVPLGYLVDNMQVKFFIDTGTYSGHEVCLSVRKVTSTTYDVFVNDNSYELKAIYG